MIFALGWNLPSEGTGVGSPVWSVHSKGPVWHSLPMHEQGITVLGTLLGHVDFLVVRHFPGKLFRVVSFELTF